MSLPRQALLAALILLAAVLGCNGSDSNNNDSTATCGDSTCGTGETCATCVADCACTGTLSCVEGACRVPTPDACATEPSIADLAFIPNEVKDWFAGLPLVGCFTVTANAMLDMDCEPVGLDASYWASLPEGLYMLVGYQDTDTPYAYAYTIGLSGGRATEAAPTPYDMPGGGGPVDSYGYFTSVAKCGAGSFATDVSCECSTCGTPNTTATYHFQVYYFRRIESTACLRNQPNGADCAFHFNCTARECSGGTCGSTSTGAVCGDNTCDAGESSTICPDDCGVDTCHSCLSACRGMTSCCTGCGCLCESECGGCW